MSCSDDYDKKEQNDKFLVNMSHEIRTPLNGIVGNIQLLSHTSLCDVQKKYLKSLNECSTQLARLINDILDISRLNCGKMKVNENCFCIRKQIYDIKDMFSHKMKDKDQIINIHLSDNVPEYIVSDEQKISQIIINLLSNAVKFTKLKGVIKVDIDSDNDENTLFVNVSDNGIGISEDHIKDIFKHFTQINPSDTSDGFGLGLSICKQLSLLLDGDLVVKSEVNKGSDFCLNVKYKNNDNVTHDFDGSNIKDMNILVIDENTTSRITLQDMLVDMLTKPICCSTEQETYHILNNSDRYNIDIVILKSLDKSQKNKIIDYINNNNPLIAIVNIESGQSDCLQPTDYTIYEPININILYETLRKTVKNFSLNETKTTSPSRDFKKNCNILITDDNQNNREVISNMLKHYGYKNIMCSSSGKDTIDIITTKQNAGEKLDILILDLKMPNISGYDVINHIKQKNWKLPKIIVVSASVLTDERNKCKQLGIDYFIPKPVNMIDLKKSILDISSKI